MYRLRGVLLGPEGGWDAELFVDAAGLVAGDPLPGPETLVAGGFLVPGLVDAHCHVGIGPRGAVPLAEQARTADGWVKLVGDWIDRGTGDLAPLWPDDVLVTAIAAAHAAGARVTAHVFGADALPGLIHAGIDCIEHGTGLTDELIGEMARRGTALVPTLINIDTFPGIAERAERFPAYAAHMRALHARAHGVVRRAVEAGVPVFAGTDAGGGIRHGRIADEVVALHAAGLPALDALGAASWAAREWLGRPALGPGAPADLVVYRDDPRTDPAVLSRPALVLLRG